MKAPKKPKPGPEHPEPIAVAEAPVDSEPEAAPEPWTEARVAEWNRYYDLYVAGAALLLIFFVSMHKLTNSSIWPQVQAGKLTIEHGWPILKDPFAYSTPPDRPWVNVSWLFQAAAAGVMKLGPMLNPQDRNQQLQISVTILAILAALARVLTGGVLLAVRRPGPGLWWSALAISLGLGVVVGPRTFLPGNSLATLLGSPMLGGLAGVTEVMPIAWGVLFLAIELLILFRMLDRGHGGAGGWLVPLFVVWANVDDTFFLGLIVLALAAIGHLVRPARGEADDEPRTSGKRGLVLLAVCAAACLLNPSFHLVFVEALKPFRYMVVAYPSANMPTDYLSFFGQRSQQFFNQGAGDYNVQALMQGYFFAYLGLGLLTFVLNFRRFSLARLLVFLAVGAMWGLATRLAPAFAVVFSATVALNGQEWYQDRFGRDGRLGLGWAAFSVGGRLATLAILTLAMFKATTGLGAVPGESYFSFGYDPDDYAFDAADALMAANLRGHVFNTGSALGDDLIGRGDGAVKVFHDSRRGIFPPGLFDYIGQVSRALRDGRKDGDDGWKKLLDDYQVSALMIRSRKEPKLEQALRASPDWVEIYFDGWATVFGRLDSPYPEDVAYFQKHVLDYDAMVYQRTQAVRSPDRPPSPMNWLDRVYRRRALETMQPHVVAARRFLEPRTASQQVVPDPAQCLLAIREARAALARKPDDTDAFRVLAVAYEGLLHQESDLLRNAGGESNWQTMIHRFRQLTTAYNYAIQTTPAPENPAAADDLRFLRRQLANLYQRMDAYDLELQQLEEASKLECTEPMSAADLNRLETIRKGLADFHERLEKETIEKNLRPLDRAQLAMQAGALGLAIEELRKEEGAAPVKPELVDLYCQIGQPDEAYSLMRADVLDDPELSRGPGTSPYRQGLVTLLAVGNYDATASYWHERAIPMIRSANVTDALMATRGLLDGQVTAAVSGNLNLPRNVLAEADWCYQTALCLLEGGRPVAQTIELGEARPDAPGRKQEIPGAAELFEQTLKIEPDFPARPIIAYYLEKLGREVPAIPTREVEAPAVSTSTPAPDLPENVFEADPPKPPGQ